MFWLIVALSTLIIELLTTALVSIWFTIGATFAYLAEKIGLALPYQIGIFAITSILAFIFTKPFVKKFLSNKIEKTNVDAIIGKNAIVVEKIVNIPGRNTGAVKVEGKVWTAKSITGEEIQSGDIVVVKKIEGVTLFVNKLNNNTPEINTKE